MQLTQAASLEGHGDENKLTSFEDIRRMQLSNGIHICLSEREGFGVCGAGCSGCPGQRPVFVSGARTRTRMRVPVPHWLHGGWAQRGSRTSTPKPGGRGAQHASVASWCPQAIPPGTPRCRCCAQAIT